MRRGAGQYRALLAGVALLLAGPAAQAAHPPGQPAASPSVQSRLHATELAASTLQPSGEEEAGSDTAGGGDGAADDGNAAAPADDQDSEPGDGTASPEDQALMDQWYAENDICRGHSGDDEETFKHCDARDAITEQLHARNWCYGHDGQAEYQREWEGCE